MMNSNRNIDAEDSNLFTENTGVVANSIKDLPANNEDSSQTSNERNIQEKKSGILGAQLNLSNTIVGAGIVGLPYAYMQCGFIIGTFLTIFVGYLTVLSCNILIRLAKFHSQFRLYKNEINSYEDLMYQPYGPYGRGFILFFMFILSYGCMIAYLLIVKDTLPKVFGYTDEDYDNTNGPEIILIIVSSLVILPISMQRDMSSLEKTSIISLLCDFILIIFIATKSPISQTIAEYGGWNQVFQDYAFNFDRLFIGLGIISTAMGCQQGVFMIYGSLHNGSRRRWWYVTVLALGMSTTLSVLIGICGSLAFMEDTKGNVLNNYHSSSPEANTARLLLAITMILTYPMESIIVRHVVIDLIYGGDMDGSHPPGSARTYWLNRREKVTILTYLMALLPALAFDDTGIVLSLTGAIAGSVLAYIGPGLAYIGVNGHAFLEVSCRLLGYYNKKISDELTLEYDTTDDEKDKIELPMIGNSDLKISSTGPNSTDYYNFINSTCCKPIWWYCLGFPLWSNIAYIGSEGMQQQLDDTTITASSNEDDTTCNELEVPKTWDFCIAIFLISFGIIAFFLGIIENVHKVLVVRDNPDFDAEFNG